MKKEFVYILSVIIALFVSCDDFLNVDPTQRAKLETPADVSKLLIDAYPQASYMPFMEYMSDNVGDNAKWIVSDLIPLMDRKTMQSFWWENVDDTSQDAPTYYWNACYKAIATANLAIQFIEQSDNPDQFSAQLGEALVCRAYAHFMLSILFAKAYDPATAQSDLGIPYVKKPETTVFVYYKRETLAKTYEWIEEDLLKGLPLINDKSYKISEYHFNRIAANAFAARFFLFKHDWPKVIAYATEALGASEVSMLRDWNTDKTGYAFLALEVLTNTYTDYREPANLLMSEVVSWYSYFIYNRYILTKTIAHEIYGNGKNVTGGSLMLERQFTSWQGGVDENLMPKIKGWFKYSSLNATTGYMYFMHPLFTAEETLLNRAEAYAMEGDITGVCRDLNIYYSKRIDKYSPTAHNITEAKINTFANTLPDNLYPIGYTMDAETMKQIKVIVDTRRKEFMHEGNRWFDIKRFNIEVTHTAYDQSRKETLVKNDLRREIQIPEDALAFDIVPNPRDSKK